MNVLIISSGFFPITGNHGGAIENLVNMYLNYNEGKKDNITVYTVKDKDRYDYQIYKNTVFRSIDIGSFNYRIQQKILNFLNKLFNLKLKRVYIKYVVNDLKLKNEENYYDIIIFENGQNFIRYFNKKIKTKSKKILHLHNDYLNISTLDGKCILNSFDEIWTVSNFIKERVEKIDENIQLNKIKTLFNCIDKDLFIKKENTNYLKQLLGIKKNDYVYIYTGRLIPEKGVLELIKAFNEINKKYDNVKLLIVGGGKGQNNVDSYIKRIQKIANNNVIFTGHVKNDEIAKYYQISNVQVIPSIWNEAFGLIVLEGVVSGLPIISSKSGGIPEIIGDNCLYVDREDLVNQLIQKMEYIYENKQCIPIFVSNYDKIISKFSMSNYVENFYNLIHIK